MPPLVIQLLVPSIRQPALVWVARQRRGEASLPQCGSDLL